MILIRIPKMPGDSTIPGYDTGDWFVADGFSFGVEREMKESGEKGGTEDINIGVGEPKECTIRKRIDRASTLLASSRSTAIRAATPRSTLWKSPAAEGRAKARRCAT